MAFLMGNSLWYLVRQSDAVSQFVLLVLLAMSIMCWTIFIGKLIIFRVKKAQLNKVLAMTQGADSVEEMLAIASQHASTVPSYFLSKNLVFLKTLLESRKTREQAEGRHEWELMQHHMDRTIDKVITNEESYLPFLSTSAAVATLLGLFGTVWGLVHAFVRISQKEVADITTVAPGIAEALMTTLAGLMVAIPALVMYNYLVARVRAIEDDLLQLADKVSFVFQHVLVR